ncbi:ATP12 family chaperone protein [Aureimonas leprariae]|uniref:ATPase n=1 Tax=Plantimonas leprariae TaxID=2615207 RepID=A0A7V7PL42_9HYPH|nr:ATP12 family protein [Aureimonas leprariae]KAB0676661.1 ATPase [Aureimonas leprariae]
MSDIRRITQPELPKRFYEAVTVSAADGGYAVLLDGRGVKTPSRRPLVLPSAAVAEAVAAEWRAQGERIDPATMPATRLANTVIEGIADDPAAVRDDAAKFVESDLLFYRADAPTALAERQRAAWDPIVAWAESHVGGRFVLGEGVMHVAQPPASLAAFRAWIGRESNPFRIAALHQMTTLTGSVLLALAVLEGRLNVEAAWAAAHVDEDWNIEQWGADAEAEARRAGRFADMRAAAMLSVAAP